MDKLKSKGLRFDEKEKIKIIDEFCETRSNNLINKADLLVEGIAEIKQKLSDTVEKLEHIDALANDYRKAKLAKNILELKSSIDPQ